MLNKALVLASGSSIRKELLNKITPHFKVLKASINERDYPPLAALELAEAKALAVSQQLPNNWVIGADQICHLNDQVFHKPKTIKNAIKTLEELKGHTHILKTAICIAHNNKIMWSLCETVQLCMKQLTTNQIIDYVNKDLPLDSCGSYKYESMGKTLFKSVSHDADTIQGLPINKLQLALKKLNII
jgi:septum formation protein